MCLNNSCLSLLHRKPNTASNSSVKSNACLIYLLAWISRNYHIFSGVGFSMLVVSFLCCVYYNVIIGWCLYYMFKSFTKVVPWSSCSNWWNTPNCSLFKKSSAPTNNGDGIVPTNTTVLANFTYCVNTTAATTIASTVTPTTGNLTAGNVSSTIVPATPLITRVCYNTTANVTANGTMAPSSLAPAAAALGGNSPSKEFWDRYVLQITDSMDDMGSLRVELLVALIVAWVLVYFCLWKGIKSSGKVVYFTATFPYVVLIVLLIRGVTLPGASKGIEFYLKPDWKKLGDAKVWAQAATQIFYSLGIGFGSLITMGSFNQFHNNCLK